jgi:hypothetical protein
MQDMTEITGAPTGVSGGMEKLQQAKMSPRESKVRP